MNWKSAYLESRILSASPLELVNILYEHAILEVQEARLKLADGDVAGRAKSISKTIGILSELESSLDHQAGGGLAANLARLYQYMRDRLTAGNIQQSDAPLAEVGGLLESLGDAWRTLSEAAGPGAHVETATGYIPHMDEPHSVCAGWSL
jgi:flagellar protein FliS